MSLTSCVALQRGRGEGVRKVIRFGLGCGALIGLSLALGTPQAIADPVVNRLYTDCQLANSTQGGRINTLAGLQADILRANPPGANSNKIQNPVIAYVVVYAITNDNNGQRVVNKDGLLLGHTGPVVCRNVDMDTVLQTTDISNVDILDVQDALILRYSPGRNRFCHTTDGFTDCRTYR